MSTRQPVVVNLHLFMAREHRRRAGMALGVTRSVASASGGSATIVTVRLLCAVRHDKHVDVPVLPVMTTQ